jgi:hypothetical protein
MSDHYKSHPSGIEAIEITQYESFLRGNILKYVLRAPYKGDELADLEKAAEYLQWEIERVKEDQFWAKFDDTVVKQRLEEVQDMRDEWDDDYREYYRSGMTRTFNNVFKPDQSNYRIKPFDEVAFPDKCQECDGDCKVC